VEEENKMEESCKLQRKRECEVGYTKVRNVDRMNKNGKRERKEKNKV
jgi:hypothetical protein